MARFDSDKRQFPLNTYREENLLNNGKRMRQPTAAEREALMGYPKRWCEGLKLPNKSTEQSRCHAVGNDFHLPSVDLILRIIFGIRS